MHYKVSLLIKLGLRHFNVIEKLILSINAKHNNHLKTIFYFYFSDHVSHNGIDNILGMNDGWVAVKMQSRA